MVHKGLLLQRCLSVRFSYIASNVMSVIYHTHNLIWNMMESVLGFVEGGTSAAVSRVMLQARFETDASLF